MQENEGHQVLKAAVLEIAVIALLIIGILGALNYFNIISLSALPFFSSLPTAPKARLATQAPKSVEKSKAAGPPTINILADLSHQLSYNNDSDQFQTTFIKGSRVSFKENVFLSTEFNISGTSSASSGLHIGSQIPKGVSSNSSYFSLVYSPKGKTWNIIYNEAGKSKIITLYKQQGEIVGRFNIEVFNEGKTLKITTFGRDKIINLNESIYKDVNKKQLIIYVAVPQANKLDIVNLVYNYN